MKNLENLNSLKIGIKTYICPNGSILRRKNNNMQNGIEYKVYGTNDCFICPDQNKCATESKRKLKDRCESEINEIKQTYYSEGGQKFIMEEDQMLKATLEH